MKKIIPILTLLILTAINWSCDRNDGDESPVYIIADWTTTDSVLGGRHYFFKMEMVATQGTLDKLTMTAVDGYNGKRDLETIELNGGTKKKYEYDYLLPIFPDSVVEMELRALVRSSEGEEWTGRKKLKVFAADYTLTETPLSLVENPAKGNNAICLAGGKPEAICTENTDASKHHVVLSYDPNGDNTALRRIITKAPNIRFAKVNSFDYANAQYNIVLNTFSSQYKLGLTKTSDDIAVGDIILVGTVDETAKTTVALGVMKIVAVPVTNDQAADVYQINVKGMAR